MRRDQDRVALREQKARIVAELRALGLTHDPRFLVSDLSVSYTASPPRMPVKVQYNDGSFVRVHGGLSMNEPRARGTVRR